MSKKVKIEVHTPFNLNLPEVAGGELPHQKFGVGVHHVSEQVATHPWVKQHSKTAEQMQKEEEVTAEASADDESEVAEAAEAEEGEDDEQGEEKEPAAQGERNEEAPRQRRFRR